MASKTSSASLFLAINLLFFSHVAATWKSCSCCHCGCGNPPTTPSTPILTPTAPTPPSISGGKCPKDALKLGVCANVLGLVNVVVGSPPTLPCCSLLQGLADLEAAACLCTAIRANVLGLDLNIPVSLSLLLNACGRCVPTGFLC